MKAHQGKHTDRYQPAEQGAPACEEDINSTGENFEDGSTIINL